MTREEFLKMSAKMGLGLALFPSLLVSCKKEDKILVNFSGKVLIVGAGAAGMMAAYSLFQNGVNFEIIEAEDTFGGRVKQNTHLADFPIDTGAEWIHASPSILSDLVNDKSKKGSVDLVPYNLETLHTYSNGSIKQMNWANTFYGEYKFTSTTWYQFFEEFIVPPIQNRMVLSSPIAEIDYSDDKVVLTNIYGDTFEGDKVIVTVPVNILKNNTISFVPALPNEKIEAINETEMPDGLKVSIKFSEKFYPDMLAVGGFSEFLNDGRLYFDGAYKKNTNDHVITLFNVGGKASELTNLGSNQAIFEAVMAELDLMFEGKATQYYMDHLVQNWSTEPYIQGAYSFYGDDYEHIMDRISEPIEKKVYFAGEALNKEEWSTVHGAGVNGRSVAESIMRG